MATAAQKQELLEQARSHYAADMLLKGTYADEEADSFRGCSVGCHLKHIKPDFDGDDHDYSDKHGIVARHYGYPEWLALLQDTIFEGLPNGESSKWHVQLAETLHDLHDDHDWSRSLHRVHVAILRVSYRTADTAQDTVLGVIELHERASRGEDVSDDIWSAAESAAESAARSAAESAARFAARSAAEFAARSAAEFAAWSAAWSAAESAARSAAESAARSAAESAARSAARSAAWSAAYQEIRDAILSAIPDPASSDPVAA